MQHNHETEIMTELLKAEAAMWKATEKRLQDYLKKGSYLLERQKVQDSIMVYAEISDLIFKEIEQLQHCSL